MEFFSSDDAAPPSSAKLPFLFPEKKTAIKEIYRRYAILAGLDVGASIAPQMPVRTFFTRSSTQCWEQRRRRSIEEDNCCC